MAWILAHWDTLASLVAFVVAFLKARKNKAVAAFLVSKVDTLATKEDREAIKADAIKAKVEGTLAPIVAKVTKGKGGGILGLVKGLLPVLALVVLSGCQTPEAGRSTAPAEGLKIELYNCTGCTVEVRGDGTGTATAAPSSEAKQESTQTTSTSATIPAKVGP